MADGENLSVLALKAAIRQRDAYCCTQCGMSNADHVAKYGRSLEVHRLAPGTPYTLDGCVTLCRPCHGTRPKSPRYGNRTDPGSVRIPSVFLEQIDKLVALNLSDRSEEIRHAVREYLKARDLWPPK